MTLFVVPRGTPNQPPVAYAFASPGGGAAPIAVSFTGTMSYDTDGTIVSYAWTFSDGGTATGMNASRTYTTAGVYQAYLTVTDDRGASTTDFVTINVTAPTGTFAAPSGLTAKVSGKTVILTWTDNATNEDGFYVERALPPAKKAQPVWTRVATLGPDMKTFAQTVTSGKWLYRVQAFRTGGIVSAYSNEVTVRVR